jgi:hypothetical protein
LISVRHQSNEIGTVLASASGAWRASLLAM